MSLRKAFNVRQKRDAFTTENNSTSTRNWTKMSYSFFTRIILNPGGRTKSKTFLYQSTSSVEFILDKIGHVSTKSFAYTISIAIGSCMQDDDKGGGNISPFASLKVTESARAIKANWAVGVWRTTSGGCYSCG